MVITAKQHLRSGAAHQQTVQRLVVQRVGRFIADNLNAQLFLRHDLIDSSQAALGQGVVFLPRDKGHSPVALVQQIIRGNLPRLLVIDVDPADIAPESRLSDDQIGEIHPGKDRGQLWA